MNEKSCENFLMAMAAVFDGEQTEFSPEELNFHLARCQNCRQEIGRMQDTFNLLKNQQRLQPDADLWLAVENRISAKKSSPISLKPFILLGLFLVAYKLLETIPTLDFGLIYKIIPLVFVVSLFVFLKENPFKINTELSLER